MVIYVFAAVFVIQIGHSETSQLIPDWTSVTRDFFDLSPGTTNPVLTSADVTDRVAYYVADPFMYHEGDAWYMFFEVYLGADDGDIGLATSSDGFHWTYGQIVLDEPFPLAYPLVFKWNDVYYMIPESYTQNQIRLYKATNFPYTWTFVATLISGKQFVDPSIFRYNNTWWMFAPTVGSTNGNTYLYYSDNLDDPASWREHPMSPIVVGDTSKSRGGGRPIAFDHNRVIRLAQKCDVIYGEAVRAFEVDTVTKTSYAEHEAPESPIVCASGSGWNKDGMHHVDSWWIGDRWLVAVDGTNLEGEEWSMSIGIYVSPVARYQLTISTNYGTVSPPSGLYDAGASITITATPPDAGPGERYVWLGWTGSGTGSYTELDNPASVTMNGPIIQTASWRHEYYLAVTSPYDTLGGEGWYEEGSGAYATLATGTVSESTGIRYVFTGWSGDATGTDLTSDAIVMDGPKTAVANWKIQYLVTFEQRGSGATVHVTYTADTDPIEAVPFSTWVKAGSTLTFSYDAIVNDGQPTRYVLVSVDQTSPLTVNGPIIITATYKTQHLTAGRSPIAPSPTTTQYYITVTSLHGSPTPSAWVDAGSDYTVSVTSPSETVPNDHQWVCMGFSIDGGEYQKGTTYTFTNIQANHTIEFAWKEQFWIQANSSHGSPTTSQWVDQGGSLTVSITSPANDDGMGTRYRCTGYTLDSNLPITDGSTSYTFENVQSAHVITFNWITQYRLTVTSDHDSPYPEVGEHWYDTDTTITATVTSPADETSGIRYRSTGFTGTGSVPSSGNLTSVTFTINMPSTLTWNWIAQYYLTVSTNFGSVSPSSNWYDAGTDINILATPPDAKSNERYLWNGWTGTGTGCYSGMLNPASITMNGPVTETASWKLQFLVVFQQTGVLDGFTVHITVNSLQHTLPYSDWFDKGFSINFVYEDTVPSATFTRYVLEATSEGSQLIIEAPIIVTGYYKIQYIIEVIVLISAIIILGGLISAIIFLKRRKAKTSY